MMKFVATLLPDTTWRGFGKLLLAMIVTALVVVQLFRFEEMNSAFATVLNLDTTESKLLGSMIVVLSLGLIAALFDVVSRRSARCLLYAFGVLIGGIWVVIGLCAGMKNANDTGFFGGIVMVSGDMVIMTVCGLLILALLILPKGKKSFQGSPLPVY